jgi:hypothetical protein
MNRVEQMKKIQNDALALFTKRILITATHLQNLELLAYLFPLSSFGNLLYFNDLLFPKVF